MSGTLEKDLWLPLVGLVWDYWPRAGIPARSVEKLFILFSLPAFPICQRDSFLSKKVGNESLDCKYQKMSCKFI